MKITIEHYDEKFTLEKGKDDLTIEEFFQMLKIVTLVAGFHSETVEKYFGDNEC